MALLMNEASSPATITIRPALPDDAEGIALVFIESAEYHAELDPERYSTPVCRDIDPLPRGPAAFVARRGGIYDSCRRTQR